MLQLERGRNVSKTTVYDMFVLLSDNQTSSTQLWTEWLQAENKIQTAFSYCNKTALLSMEA